MPKTISGALESHIGQSTTSLATLWKLTRLDGQQFFFTDHDSDITYNGDTYEAAVGYNRTAVSNQVGFSVDNLDVEGFLDSSALTETELRAGVFDYAQVLIAVINWEDPSQGVIILRKGRLGEISYSDSGLFKTELRGLAQAFSQRIVELYQPECRADLGDSRCGIPIQPDLIERDTNYSLGDFVRVATDSGSGLQDEYENRIYECTRAGITLSVSPTYDTTVDNITEEAEAATGVLTLTGNAVDTETVVIDGKTYTFQDTLTDSDGNIQIGGDADASIANLVAAINLDAGAGTAYADSTTVHPTVEAAEGTGDTLDATAKVPGTDGNSIATTDTLTNGSWGAAMLSGGLGGAQFTAREAWSRNAVVATVTDNRTFTITVDESRAVDDWFKFGAAIWETGDNAGAVMEVKGWTQSSDQVVLFLSMPFDIQVGDSLIIYAGCDKRVTTCANKFSNVLNFRGEPYVPGQDELLNYPDAR